MNIQTTSNTIEVSESMKALAAEKLAGFGERLKHLPEDAVDFRVSLDKLPEDKFGCKLSAILNGKHYFAETKEFQLETCIKHAVEDCQRQYEKDQQR